MALSFNLGYQESISVHPTRRQNFAGKVYSNFPNIWEWLVWKFSKQELILTVISTPSSPIPSKCDAALSIHLMFCSTSKVGRFQFIAPGLHRYIAMCKLCTLQFIGVQLENIPSTFPYSSIEDQLHLCLEVDLARVFSEVISRSCIRCLHLWPRPTCSNFP